MGPNAGRGQGGCDVLVVDDDEATVDFVVMYLSAKHVAARGLKGSSNYLQDIRDANPRVVLLDVALPGANGYHLCAELKRARETRHIRVILFTAVPPADVIANVGDSGADGYLLKPFTLPGIDQALGIGGNKGD